MGGALWIAVAGVAALGVVLYLTGKGQSAGRAVAPMLTAAAALFVAAPAAIAAFPALTATTADKEADDNTIAFSPEKLAQLRASDTPVFLYFTADWCITCKANEAAVLNRDDITDAFAAKGVIVMRADFTRRDATIAAYLADKGRAGVPLYLYFPPNAEPTELPQILTQDVVKSAIARG